MNRVIFTLATAVSLSIGAAGCAGQLSLDEQEQLCAQHPGCLGGTSGPTSTGAGGSTGATTGSTGAGGSGTGAMVDMCVVNSMKSCQAAGCHGGSTVSAMLNLDTPNLTMNFKSLYLNQPNKGMDGGCMAGQFKLIDATNPMNSLLYTKLQTTPPCGLKMPEIGTITAADTTCVLSWINSVIAAGP